MSICNVFVKEPYFTTYGGKYLLNDAIRVKLKSGLTYIGVIKYISLDFFVINTNQQEAKRKEIVIYYNDIELTEKIGYNEYKNYFFEY